MADPIKIVITADVNSAISNIGKLNTKLASVDDVVADVIKGSANLDDALDKLGKQGLLSVNSLQQSINDFKAAFNDATDPEEAKKFGDALKVLEQRQKSLIDTGLGLAASEDKVSKAHAGHVTGANKLSSSIFGLTKIFQILPPELSHLTHGFDQVLQSYESVTHGTEGAGESVKKFAGVLGQVGLGLAISVAVGLLTTFISELLNTDAALEKATEEGIRFSEAIGRIDDNIKASKESIKFIGELSDLNVDINFGKGFEADLLKVRGGFEDLRQEAFTLGESLKEATIISDEAFKSMQEGISDAGRAAIAAFPLIQKIPDAAIKSLGDADKQFIDNAKSTAAARAKIQDDILKIEQAQELQRSRIRLVKTDEERKQEKERNDALRALLESRANIIKEFTAKFASIGDPFPSFFTKNLPLGRVEDKALRAALENAFKVLSEAAKDLFNTQKIDPGTIPLEIHFKPEIVGKSALVRLIEDKFGEIKKEVEDSVNKGIFEVPLDFKLPSEGDGQALKVAEDLVNDLAKSIESLSGQKKAILNFDFDVNKLNAATAEQVLINAENEINRFASNVPLKLKVNADLSVTAIVDKERVIKELNTQINDIVAGIATDSFANLGQAIGDALSGEGVGDAFKQFGNIIAKGLEAVGKALIAAGVKMALAKAALSKIALSPALSIAAGIALIALSRLLQNSIGTSRQMGGNVKEGLRYIVNEAGPEIFKPNQGEPSWLKGRNTLFTPSVSGTVIPAWQAKLFAAQNNMPAFQFGGLVSGPTFGLLGEGANISRSNPEVIAPLDSLKSLLFNPNIGIQNNLSVKLRVRDIILGSARENRSQRRNT